MLLACTNCPTCFNLYTLWLIDMIDWGTEELHIMHINSGRRVRFQRLLFTMAKQSHLLMRLMLPIMLLHILLPVRNKFHLPTHHSLHPSAGARFHLFKRQRYPSHWWYQRHHFHLRHMILLSQCHFLLLILFMLLSQCHLLLLMVLSQCYLQMVRLPRMLSYRHLEEAL